MSKKVIQDAKAQRKEKDEEGKAFGMLILQNPSSHITNIDCSIASVTTGE